MIVKVNSKEQLAVCLDIIQRSFITVANDFNLTKDNCPSHTAFMPLEKLRMQYEEGRAMFFYEKDGEKVGYFSLKKSGNNAELDNLAVLPSHRHLGIGREIIEFAKKYAGGRLLANKITIGIIEENAVLKKWYESLGFVHTGTQKFPHLPFTVGFMEINIKGVIK